MPNTNSAAPTVGSDVLAYCGSCKMDLNAVVVAMKGDRVAKVQCHTCKKERVYKAPKGIDTPTAPKKRASKKKEEEQSATSIEAEWEKLMTTHRDVPTKSYTTQGQFLLGDKIKHPSFGEGIVSRLIYPNKVEVIFRTDLKILIYAGVQQTM